ncbi:uncharacterized protein [Ciconia boyciana]|uniref:uncharacterized protein n=1 Tax=Ciconia boyciana TaxID=52775 RepID=UPI003B9EDAF1
MSPGCDLESPDRKPRALRGAPHLQRAPLLRQKLEAPVRYTQLHQPPKGVKQEEEVWPLPPTRGRAKPAGRLTRSSAPALRLSSPVRQQPLLPPQHLPQLGEAPAPQAGGAAAARRCHAAPRRRSPGQPPEPGAASAAPRRPPSYRKRRQGGRARLGRKATPSRPPRQASGRGPAPSPLGGPGSAGEATPSTGRERGETGVLRVQRAVGAFTPRAGTRFDTLTQAQNNVGRLSSVGASSCCAGRRGAHAGLPAGRVGRRGDLAAALWTRVGYVPRRSLCHKILITEIDLVFKKHTSDEAGCAKLRGAEADCWC